jgi:hypothetical protein
MVNYAQIEEVRVNNTIDRPIIENRDSNKFLLFEKYSI